MNPRERIVRLEGLLDRVQRNTSRPRARRASVPTVTLASAPFTPVVPAAVAPPSAPPPVAAAAPPPPPVVEAPSWRAEPASTVQARPSSIPPEELSEDDLVEVTTVPPPPDVDFAASVSSIPVGEVEEPPASSRRSKVAESLDQAIANAAEQVDEHEVPIHTPPPESGPQEAVLPVGIEAPRAPEFAELSRPPSLGPTPEQLGETIELEEAEGPTLEIEDGGLQPPEQSLERPAEELEVTLPRAEMPSGLYDVSASMPVEVAPIVPSAEPTVSAGAGLIPDVTPRPAIEDAEVTRVVRVSEKTPENFSELLEATLHL